MSEEIEPRLSQLGPDEPASPPSGDREEARRAEQRELSAEEELALLRMAGMADDQNPLGVPGRPFRRSPFVVGFLGTLGALVAIVLGQALASISSALILIVVGLYLAVGLNPLVEGLERRGLRRGLAITAVFFGFLLVITLFIVAIVPPLIKQTTDFVSSIPDLIERLNRNPQFAELDRNYDIVKRVQGFFTRGDFYTNLFGGILGIVGRVFGAVFSVFTVIVLTLYFLGSLDRTKRFAVRLVPASRRPRVTLISDEILSRIGGYVGGQLAIALIAGAAAYVFMLIAGVPYALPLAMIVSFLALVPQVGATLGGAVMVIISLTSSLALGIASLVFVILYQQVENYVIYPRIMRHTVDVAPAVTIIAALIGGSLLGIVGALLAIPTAAAVRILVDEVVVPRQDEH
jgi:predicted PurR-regulated permease PerM